jgi:cobalt-zinc-cadmium efflux system outer membrane protein
LLYRFPRALSACIGIAAVWTTGCQNYRPQPLDLARHRDEWLARSPESGSVAEYARRFAALQSEVAKPFDVADGLTSGEAELVALVFNPDLRIARLEANVARAGAENAGLWQDPTLGVDLERILSSVEHPWIVASTIGVTIPLSGRLGAEKGAATATSEAAMQTVLAEEWRIRIAVREAWRTWVAAQRRAELATDTLRRVDSIVSIVDRLEQGGEIGRVDSRLFRVEQATRRSDLAVLESQTREAELRVRALMGLSPDAPLTFVAASGSTGDLDAEGDLAARLESGNLELATVASEYHVAEQRLRLEIRKQYPDLTIGPGGKQEDGDTRVLLGLSLPLPLWNQNRRGVAEALAQREVAQARYETTFERLAGELARARLRYAAAIAQRSTLENEIVPLVDEQYADVQRLSELGQLDAFVLFESISRQHAIKARLIDAHLSEALAAHQIESLIGPAQTKTNPAIETSTPEDTTP